MFVGYGLSDSVVFNTGPTRACVYFLLQPNNYAHQCLIKNVIYS